MRPTTIIRIAVVSLGIAGATNAGVLVVDLAGGPGVFPDLPSAIQASSDGDIVLVHAGDYTSVPSGLFNVVSVGNRALTIVADPPGANVLVTAFNVANLAAGKQVVIRGIDTQGTDGVFGIGFHGIQVTSSAGTVLVEDATLRGGVGGAVFNQGQPGYPGVRVANAKLTLTRCVVRGGPGYFLGGPASPGAGGPGAVLTANASVAIFDSVVEAYDPPNLVAAGPGISMTGSSLMVSGTEISGGTPPATCVSCAGGDGVTADAASTVRWLDSTFLAGVGAFSPLPIDAPPGIVSSWPGSARGWTISSPGVEFQPVSVTITGITQDNVLFFWSPLGGHLPIGGVQAWLVVGPPVFGPFFLGTITDPSGVLAFTTNAPALVPATIDGFTFALQPFFQNGSEIVAGAPTTFTLLR